MRLRSTRAAPCARRARSTATDSSRRSPPPRMHRLQAVGEELAASTSRRGFLAKTSRLLALVAGGSALSALIKPGEADAYHFCGHIYTTDSCPHPTGLPRIDARGYPLRAADGHPVDDLGRPVNAAGQPVDPDGS